MPYCMNNDAVCELLSLFPSRLRREIERISSLRRGGIGTVSEIRISSAGPSSLRFFGKELFLLHKASRLEVSELLRRVTSSSLYAYADTIKKGYIPMPHGVRVGVVGISMCSGATFSVSDISTLVFRIPTEASELSDELYEAYLSGGGGMLIYSPPGLGKTTALRSLGRALGKRGRRVAVIDERCEFDPAFFYGAAVDVLSGYSRKEGIEIAVRTLAPEVIMVDELMGGECRELLYAMRSGVPVVATTHAQDACEIYEKREIGELISAGVFGLLAGISGSAGKRRLTVTEAKV